MPNGACRSDESYYVLLGDYAVSPCGQPELCFSVRYDPLSFDRAVQSASKSLIGQSPYTDAKLIAKLFINRAWMRDSPHVRLN